MSYTHKLIPDRHRNIKFLAALSDKRLFLCFTFFHLASDKFPQQSPRLILRPLTDHKSASIPNKRCNNFYHIVTLLCQPKVVLQVIRQILLHNNIKKICSVIAFHLTRICKLTRPNVCKW